MRTLIVAVSLILGVVLAAAPALADRRFHPVPGKGKTAPVALRVVAYDGATNGVLTVELKNRTGATQRFSADGLYFVPDGDPDTAPQRLGAVGPIEIARGDKLARETAVTLAPGETIEVRLDVFCIDSHRSSPSSANTFTIGKTRMPKALSKRIESTTRIAADEAGGYAAPAAKAAIQSEVWKQRDKAWIELDGEGVQEAAK